METRWNLPRMCQSDSGYCAQSCSSDICACCEKIKCGTLIDDSSYTTLNLTTIETDGDVVDAASLIYEANRTIIL